MNREAQKILGTQVKELLSKAVGGIYVGRCMDEVVTNIFEEYKVTGEGLEISVDKFINVRIPVDESEQYINYAISGEDLESDEEWEGSKYFDYKFCIANYVVCFNVEDKGAELTWEQFKELSDVGTYRRFEVRSIDTCSIYIDISDCTIAVNDREIEINAIGTNTIIDRDIVDAIYNDSVDAKDICYRLEFNNGMSDMCIEVEYAHRLFR